MQDDTGGEPSTTALGSTILRRTRHRAPWQLALELRHGPVLILVRQGACQLRHPSEGTFALSSGDLALVLGPGARVTANDAPGGAMEAAIGRTTGAGDAIERTTEAGAQPLNGASLLRGHVAHEHVTELARVEYASGATLVPGVLGLLRPVVHFRAEHGHGDREVAAMVRLVDAELDRVAPGRHALLGRLLESLFVYAARAALGGAACAPAIDLDAICDGQIARALDHLHARPADPWTVEGLARAAGLSRAAFARRFVAATGVAPLRYLAQWRMQLSERLLVETDESLASIAARVGYESEFAFSRAFKRHRGVAPGAFRRAHRAAWHRAAPGRPTPTRAAA